MRPGTPVSIKILAGLIILSAVPLFLRILEAETCPFSLYFQIPLLASFYPQISLLVFLSLVLSLLLAIVYIVIGVGIWKMRRWAWKLGIIFFTLSILWNSLMEMALKNTVSYDMWMTSFPLSFLGIILSLIVLILLCYKRKFFVKERISIRSLILVGVVLVTAFALLYYMGRIFPTWVILTSELTPECENKTYVTDRADYIVEGVVEKVKIEHPGGVEIPDYYVVVKVEKFIKGRLDTDRIQVVFYGSTRYEVLSILSKILSPEEIKQRFSWIDEIGVYFREGERVRICFEKGKGNFFITNKFFTTCSVFGIEKMPKE